MAELKDTYRDFILPLLAVAETIGTKGRSPGTVAMSQQDILRRAEETKKAEERAAREEALQKELRGYQIGEYKGKESTREREQKKADEEAAKRKLYEKEYKEAPDEERVGVAESYLTPEQFIESRKQHSMGGTAAAIRQLYNTPENRTKVHESITNLINKGTINKDMEPSLRVQTDSDPLGVSEYLGRFTGNIQGAVKTFETLSPLRIKQIGRETEIKTASRLKVPPTIAKDFGEKRTAVKMLDNMMSKAEDLNLWFMPADKLRALNPWDTAAQGFNQLVATTKQVIGKGLEGGVLRKEDEDKYEKIIPRLGDTKDVLRKKATQLREMLVLNHNEGVTAQNDANYDVSKFNLLDNINYYPKKEKKDSFTIGKIYTDANGNKARYKGNDQWEEIK